MIVYNALLLTSLLASSSVLGAPIQRMHKREVPQEHSHEKYLRSVNALLQLNNPDEIQDAVFGLLGNAAGSKGQGKITDTDCLHQATADQAFTNAKEAGDVQGQVDALIFAALERNTGSVGLKSVLCTSITPVNPEIAAFTQIQDPASEGAAEGNKATILALAAEIAKLGGDPAQALDASTFQPGEIGDPTAAGNTCDDANDPEGCIFTQNLIDIQVSEAEIAQATADIVAARKFKLSRRQGGNLQSFAGALGGIAPPTVSNNGGANKAFEVEGNAAFDQLKNALRRSCDVQNNQCANAANKGGTNFSVADCNAQQQQCLAGADAAKVRL